MSVKGENEKICCEGNCGKDCCKKNRYYGKRSGGDAVYGLGMIGSAIYFIQHASGFWPGVLGVLEAIVWPVIVVYKLLESLL